ncbi:MAG: hypothetical protein M1833_006961 [Piccolia ochrophora]|nr:MAG: hypothetical protein M1833_006961 [Piccolia ochrophora]
MAPFVPVYVARSDGKLQLKEGRNEPTGDQLKSTPDAKGVSDFYKKLEDGDAKEIDWRRKLGGMLMRQLGGKEYAGNVVVRDLLLGADGPVGKNYILAQLPDNYQLFEHVKYTVSETTGNVQKSGRNHAKGPNDRQDAYLYGHPQGRKKRYRSPGDFFPHLLWLGTDKEGDPGNCTCKLCSPEEYCPPEIVQATGQPKEAKGVKPEMSVKEATSEIKPGAKTTEGKGFAVVIPPKNETKEPAKPTIKPSPSPVPTSNPSAAAQPVAPANPQITSTASPLPLPRSREQQLDSQYNQFLYRSGELVWFSRETAWGLGIVLKRERVQDAKQQAHPRYLVQPLSHPHDQIPPVIKTGEGSLRPWLAWTTPHLTHAALQAPGLTYDNVDWSAVINGQYGPGDLEIDASIFAAKAIDDTYTLFGPFDMPTAATGETYWNGVFVGAEKIWLGEPVRLRIGSGMSSEIMIVHDIIERTRPGIPPIVILIGDIYAYAEQHSQTGHPPDTPALPRRLRMDLHYRNSATLPTRLTTSYWKLIRPLSRVTLADIKGRWYESSLLLPVLRDPTEFSAAVARGDVPDTGLSLNARGDSQQQQLANNNIGRRVASRLEALGHAVPAGTQISRGADGSEAENQFPREAPGSTPMNPEDAGQGHGQGEADIEQFMDLDQYGGGVEGSAGGQYFGDVGR